MKPLTIQTKQITQEEHRDNKQNTREQTLPIRPHTKRERHKQRTQHHTTHNIRKNRMGEHTKREILMQPER